MDTNQGASRAATAAAACHAASCKASRNTLRTGLADTNAGRTCSTNAGAPPGPTAATAATSCGCSTSSSSDSRQPSSLQGSQQKVRTCEHYYGQMLDLLWARFFMRCGERGSSAVTDVRKVKDAGRYFRFAESHPLSCRLLPAEVLHSNARYTKSPRQAAGAAGAAKCVSDKTSDSDK